MKIKNIMFQLLIRANAGVAEKLSQAPNRWLAGFFFGVRLMEHRSDSIQDDKYPRSSPFGQLSPQCSKERFDIVPIDDGAHRICEGPGKSPQLFFGHVGTETVILACATA
jgi:hypothetical protein